MFLTGAAALTVELLSPVLFHVFLEVLVFQTAFGSVCLVGFVCPEGGSEQQWLVRSRACVFAHH